MPKYRITSPDGKTYEITAPDGASMEEVKAYAMNHHARTFSPPATTNYDPTDGMSTFDKAAAGAGKAVYDAGRGIGQLVGLQSQSDIDEAKRLDAPLMKTKAGIAGNIGGNIAMVAIPGAAAMKYGSKIPLLGRGLSTLGRISVLPTGIKESALAGTILGGTQPVSSDESRLNNAVIGAVSGGIVPAAFGGLAKVGEFTVDHLPTNTALKSLRDLFGEGRVPTEAPTIGMTADKRGLSPDFMGPITPKYGNIPDIKPTIGMISDSPEIIKLEQNARLRNPQKFMPVDAENNAAVYRGLQGMALSDSRANTLQDLLNAKTTPLRESALASANLDPSLTDAIDAHVLDLMAKPGIRDSSAMPLLNKAEQRLKRPDIQAEDLYSLRKDIAESLNMKGIALDDMATSAKNNRRLTTELINHIDDSINSSSGGEWEKYLAAHSAGMKPIEEGRAFQDILEKFRNSSPILGHDTPNITPHALRMAVDKETMRNTGREGMQSIMSGQGKSVTGDAMQVMNDIEKAKKGAVAVTGSPTATFGSSLVSSILPKGGITGHLIDYLNKAGIRSGNNILDEAALDPKKLQILLEQYARRPPINRTPIGNRTNRLAPVTTSLLSSYLAQQ